MALNNNLLSALYKWAHRQDENFLTEAFVQLLRHLLDSSPSLGVEMVRRITSDACALQPDEADLITLSTQINTDMGRPDIEIRTPECLVYIEVKKESGLGHKQLERYRSKLLSSGFSKTKLVLLTRYPVSFEENGEKPDLELRWIQISEWLECLRSDSAISDYLIKQFLMFLYERGIRMEKVGWQLPEGQRALRSLLAMIGEAISSNDLKIHQKTAGWDWIGYYLEGKSCFIGFYFDEPDVLRFEGYLNKKPISPELSSGELDGTTWNNRLSLSSEDKDFFFAQSKTNQFRLIEKFLHDSWSEFRRMRCD